MESFKLDQSQKDKNDIKNIKNEISVLAEIQGEKIGERLILETDDTGRIQRAIDSILTGGTVSLPDKELFVSGTIQVSKNDISIIGVVGKTKITKIGTGSLFRFNDSANTTYYVRNAIIGVKMEGQSGAEIAVEAHKLGGFRIINCHIKNFGGDGIRLNDVTQFLSFANDIRNNGGNGISAGYKSDAGLYLNTNFQDNLGYGIVIGFKPSTSSVRCNGNTITGCTFLKNKTGGLLIRDASTNATNISGNYFENNTTNHIVLSENGVTIGSVIIDSNYFNGSTVAINTYDVNSVDIKKNFFENQTSLCLKMNVAIDCDWQGNQCVQPIEDNKGIQYSSGYRHIQFGRALWDLDKRVNIGFVLPAQTISGRPAPSVNLEGYIYALNRGTGASSSVQVCLKNGSDVYEWIDMMPVLYGSTAQRPLLGSTQTGVMYWDNSIQKPIWWTGTLWKDATGTTV